MIPIYKARKLLKVIEPQFGHTQPWVVLCEGENGLAEFVVKVFTENHLSTFPRVHGEFAGSWLASEFDLLTPSVGWIELEEHFLRTLPPSSALQIDFDDDRLKFGSKVLNPFQHFPVGLKAKDFKKLIPISRLFAFDNLIRNSDRGTFKPNLLLTDSEAYLIDHEFSLDINEGTIQDLKDSNWEGKFSSSHITYPYLSSGSKSDKVGCFDDFNEYLRALNLNEFRELLVEVEGQGYNADIDLFMEYFIFIKRNPSIFTNLLKGLIL